MKSTEQKIQEIKDKFKKLFDDKTEDEMIKHDELLLMASFLSEIEAAQKIRNVNRGELARLIKTSPSYLTQVFSGDKPLNFNTLAKIQKTLNIRFFIQAKYKEANSNTWTNVTNVEYIQNEHIISHNLKPKYNTPVIDIKAYNDGGIYESTFKMKRAINSAD